MAQPRVDRVPEAPADAGEPVAVYPIWRNGEVVDWYVVRDEPIDTSDLPKSVQDALNAIGAWSDLDWEEALAELDRIRHESKPTPPIDEL